MKSEKIILCSVGIFTCGLVLAVGIWCLCHRYVVMGQACVMDQWMGIVHQVRYSHEVQQTIIEQIPRLHQ